MKGETPVYAPVQAPAAVIDLMAALKQSLEKDGAARKPAARGKREAAPAEKAAAKAPPAANAAPAKPASRAAARRKAS
jgi:non-homologous end joining protein Ku